MIKISWLLTSIIVVLQTSSFMDVIAGGGVGTGDGFPNGPQFSEKRLGELPEKEEIQRIAVKLAYDYPTLGARVYRLSENLGKSENHRIIHLQGHYPYEFANSNGTLEVDPFSIPKSTSITIWNDFFVQSPEKRREIILHELVHRLITRSDEGATQEITNEMLKFSDTTTRMTSSRLQVLLKEFFTTLVPLHAEIPLALKFFEMARETGSPLCSEWNSLSTPQIIGKLKVQFPQAPNSWSGGVVESVSRDGLFRIIRDDCLKSNPIWFSFLKEFFSVPEFHKAFVEAWTGAESNVRLHAADTSIYKPATEGAVPLLERFYEKSLKRYWDDSGKISVKEVESVLPGFSKWVEMRNSLLSPNERKPIRYTQALAGRLPMDLVSQNASLLMIENDEGDIGTCTRLDKDATSEKVHLRCVYREVRLFGLWQSSSTAEWWIDHDWSMEVMQRAKFNRLELWPELEVVESVQ